MFVMEKEALIERIMYTHARDFYLCFPLTDEREEYEERGEYT